MQELLRNKWSSIVTEKYGEGIQEIVETLTNEQLLEYLLDSQKDMLIIQNPDEPSSRLVAELKTQLAKAELLKRISSKN